LILPTTNYTIADVATVEEGIADRVNYTRLDGKDTIILDVRKQSGTNTVQVADAVKATYSVLVNNGHVRVNESGLKVNAVTGDLIQAPAMEVAQ
jgi:multidrug efflux pump subunit AcrB